MWYVLTLTPDLLRDQTSFQARFAEENRVPDDFDKFGLLTKTDEMTAGGLNNPQEGEKFYKFMRDLNIV